MRTFVLDGTKGASNIRRALRDTPGTVILSKSRDTTVLLKSLAPEIPVWHLTSTCSIVKNAVARGVFPSMEQVINRLRTNRFPALRCAEEQQAVRLADRILVHTKNMKFWYYTFYPHVRDKIEEEIFWDYPIIKRQFHDLHVKTVWEHRPIDVLFVASDWRRGEKNFPLLRQLCRSFRHKKLMAVGFVPHRLPGSVIAFDTMSQADVVQAMVQAKVVVCPSRYDEAPNILFEAAIAGANIVCSRNCGNYQIADPSFVAPLTLKGFIKTIHVALRGYRPPNTDYFAERDLCQWLIRQLAPEHSR